MMKELIVGGVVMLGGLFLLNYGVHSAGKLYEAFDAEQQAKKDRFMDSCLAEKKHYECEALFRY